MGERKISFEELKTREDFDKLFQNRPKWNELNNRTIEIIINKFIVDLQAFYSFIEVSEGCDLVERYIKLRLDVVNDSDYIYNSIGTVLYNYGSLIRDNLLDMLSNGSNDTTVLTRLLNWTFMCYESAIIINKYNVGSYYQIAYLKFNFNPIGQKDEGRKYCQKGLNIINELNNLSKVEITHYTKAALKSSKKQNKLLISLMNEYKE